MRAYVANCGEDAQEFLGDDELPMRTAPPMREYDRESSPPGA
jgi:hypothetical protein